MNNIFRYKFGNPFETYAVENKENYKLEEGIKNFKVSKEEFITLNYSFNKEDVVYGLGENIRGINKRGWIYESFCSDDPNHAPDKKALYGAHNFFIIYGKKSFGVFIDFPSKVVFDVGYSNREEFKITIEGQDYDIYIIEGDSLKEISHNFLKLIGKSYVPPKWAFGYIQSRWSYPTEEDVTKIVDTFIEKDIPLDGVCLDLDYMEDYKDFSLSKERFPNFEKVTKDLKDKGVKLIPIIDAGVKIEKGYDVYEEGIENNYFSLNENGEPFVAAVWPGLVHFPDFLNKDCRKWFGKKYKKLIDMGIEGFWNDMNEPAIFYSEDGLKKAYEEIDELRKKELNIDSFFKFKDVVLGLSNSLTDYKGFYHNTEEGIKNHYDLHNLYGYNMTKSASEGFNAIDENKRYLLFSRASYIGAHKHGGIWTGDNCSWWEHFKMNITMLPNINMCGFIYSGADTGGFGSNVDEELIIRWNQFSIFAPLYRNHAAIGTRNQEPFAFGKDTEKILRRTIQFRYGIIPYLYSEFMKCVNNYETLIRPLTFDYNDKFLPQVEDQLLIGDSIMVSPVYEQNKRGRYVYLPEEMLLWKVKDLNSKDFDVIEKGHHYIDVALNEFPLFIRKNKIFVYGDSAQSTELLSNKVLHVIAFVEDKAEYELYDDNGISKDYLNGDSSNLNITITFNEDKHNILISSNGEVKVEKLLITIVTLEGKIITDERCLWKN